MPEDFEHVHCTSINSYSFAMAMSALFDPALETRASPKIEFICDLVSKTFVPGKEQEGRKILIVGEDDPKNPFALSIVYNALTTRAENADSAILEEKDVVRLYKHDGYNKSTMLGSEVKRFQAEAGSIGGGAKVCFLNFRDSTGLKFTAATDVVILAPPVSAPMEEQAIHRVVRLGSKHKEIHVHRLCMRGTFEAERVAKRRKRRNTNASSSSALWENEGQLTELDELRTRLSPLSAGEPTSQQAGAASTPNGTRRSGKGRAY